MDTKCSVLKRNRKRGRPSKFCQEIADKIITYVRAGNYVETSAISAGITKETLYQWIKAGVNAKSGELRDFSDALTRAIEEAELADVASISRAGRGYPTKKVRTVTKPVTLSEKRTLPDGTVIVSEHIEHVTETIVEETKEFDWRASAWRIERRNPKRWGRREYLDVNANISEKPVEALTDDELNNELNELLSDVIAPKLP